MDPRTAWVVGLLSMLALAVYTHHKTGDLRLAFMVALFWGKILAGVYWLLGLDYPLYRVYLYDQATRTLRPLLTVSANLVVFLLFLLTNAAIYAWPRIRRELRLTGELPGVPATRRR